MALYLVVVFIPVILTNFSFYWKISEGMKAQRTADLQWSLEKKQEQFRKLIEGLIGYTSALYSDVSLYNALDTLYVREEDMLQAYYGVIHASMNRFVPLDNQIYDAYVYTNNPSLIPSGVLKRLPEQNSIDNWYEQMKKDATPGKLIVYANAFVCGEYPVFLALGDCSQPDLSIIRKLDFYKGYSHYDKYIRIDISSQFVESVLQDRTSPGHLYLLNAEGRVIFSSTDTGVGEQLGEVREVGKLVLHAAYNDLNYLKGWELVGVYPEEQLLLAVLKSQPFIVYLTLVNFLLPSVFILLFSRSLTSRIGVLLKQMKQVKNQRFEPLRIQPSHDEIGQLTEEFDRMTIQISKLIQEVYVAELDRKQAQFNALQSQINPHYLFNTLESIRMNCLSSGELETASIIRRLARGLRRSLQWGEDRIPLREEIDFVIDFLEIHKFRFEQRLHYELSIDAAAYELTIPKLSILPLVENACIHGVEQIEGEGRIQISACFYEQGLRIEVTDNGPGIDEEEVERLKHFIVCGINEGQRIGLKNVYDRLKWQFGPHAALEIESGSGAGTSIILFIPVNREEAGAGPAEGEADVEGHRSG